MFLVILDCFEKIFVFLKFNNPSKILTKFTVISVRKLLCLAVNSVVSAAIGLKTSDSDKNGLATELSHFSNIISLIDF